MNNTTGVDIFGANPFLRTIRDGLANLDLRRQLAFAAYCSEMLFPLYEAYAQASRIGDASELRRILDELWLHTYAEAMKRETAARHQDRLEGFDLSREECAECGGAVDAVGATWSAFDCWRKNPAENAAKAAGTVISRVDQRLMEAMVGTDYVLSPKESGRLRQKIDRHPIMERVRSDLLNVVDFLRIQPELAESTVTALRSRATKESMANGLQ